MTILMGRKTASTVLRVFFDNSEAVIILSTICGFCSKMSLQIEFKFGHLTCQWVNHKSAFFSFSFFTEWFLLHMVWGNSTLIDNNDA